MAIIKTRTLQLPLILLSSVIVCASCAHGPSLVGTWKQRDAIIRVWDKNNSKIIDSPSEIPKDQATYKYSDIINTQRNWLLAKLYCIEFRDNGRAKSDSKPDELWPYFIQNGRLYISENSSHATGYDIDLTDETLRMVWDGSVTDFDKNKELWVTKYKVEIEIMLVRTHEPCDFR